jgi:hypothetical protein|nr:MAG TPA: PHOTOSYSTEM I SUBUNIT PSAA, PHOTOSYSTEM PROTEIN, MULTIPROTEIN-PIGMENT COMPLEX, PHOTOSYNTHESIS [Caudoviricetes sp.]
MQSITVIAMDKDGYCESFVVSRENLPEVTTLRDFGWAKFIVKLDDDFVYTTAPIMNTAWNNTTELVVFACNVFAIADLYEGGMAIAYIEKCLHERRSITQFIWEVSLTCTEEEFMRFMRDKLIDSGMPEDVLPYIDMESYVDHVIERNDLYYRFTGLLTGIDYVTEI